MVVAADYPFLEILGTMVAFFAWVVWLWMIIVLLTNVFSRTDIGGWAKAGWAAFMILLPFVGVLTYLIAEHRQLAEAGPSGRARGARRSRYNGAPAENGDPAAEIEKGKQLLDSGVITPAEFESIKTHALAH
jgi:hypothetical protein